eukprot:TRINITY_DN2130_c0_g1_i1.p1 TRINITY_DN2130_c0_g1~~TRINITY_DN2130_c0_g1_i1.p1  ORF type:complete len:421 (+),score=75.72 TRINITY_DN2130_c0_g1_i1:39-1301(+)
MFRLQALNFFCNFDSGNIGDVSRIGENEYEIGIRGDINNEKYKLWYYFGVKNPNLTGLTCLLHIYGFSKKKSLYFEGLTPVVKSKLHPKWIRLPPLDCKYWKRGDGVFVLSFLFNFVNPQDTYYFAYCFPYSYNTLQKYLFELNSQSLSFVNFHLLTRTHFYRRIDLLTITECANTVYCPTIVVSSRIHPGETPSSFIMKGLIDFLVSNHPSAVSLRKLAVIHLIPMLNPDGVSLGNYRTDTIGHDLNRIWDEPCPYRHPSVFALKTFLKQLQKDKSTNLVLYIDLHAHSTGYNCFSYANSSSAIQSAISRGFCSHDKEFSVDLLRPLQALKFPRLLAKNCSIFSPEASKYIGENDLQATGRFVMGAELFPSRCQVYTIEASFFAHHAFSAGQKIIVPFTPESYAYIGSSIGQSILEYLV